MTTLCYSITGHGYGHAVRSAQVLKALPAEWRVIVRTTVPERLFREEVPGRVLEYAPAEFDCGCVQTDSVTVEVDETLARYQAISARNRAHLAEEIAFLRREKVQAVVSDIASFPLWAAREAGIPGVAVTNFTWHDIYAAYPQTPPELLGRMAEEYGAATLACLTPLATPTVGAVFPRTESVPLVARRGRPIRPELDARLGTAGRRLALLYLGTWGVDFDWASLERLSEWVFLTYGPPPRAVANVRDLDSFALSHADVAASVDAVISKTGYGTVTECIANSVPLIYLPREGFVEHAALVAGMEPWGGGIEVAPSDFQAGRWRESLDRALSARLNPDAYATDGASVVAARLAILIS